MRTRGKIIAETTQIQCPNTSACLCLSLRGSEHSCHTISNTKVQNPNLQQEAWILYNHFSVVLFRKQWQILNIIPPNKSQTTVKSWCGGIFYWTGKPSVGATEMARSGLDFMLAKILGQYFMLAKILGQYFMLAKILGQYFMQAKTLDQYFMLAKILSQYFMMCPINRIVPKLANIARIDIP